MSKERDPNSYRPSSPDLSGFNAPPPPRLSRIPSYHVPDSSISSVYAPSPRGSYDASPFFSPQTATPSTSYFASRAPPSGQPTYRTPSLPNQPPPPNNPRLGYQQFNNPPAYAPTNYPPHQPQVQPENQYQPPPSQPYLEQAQNHHFASQPSSFPFSYGDMARTRQSRAADNYDATYNPNAPPPAPTSVKVESTQPLIPMAAPDPSHGVDVRTKFPVARIKRIMQADEDVGKVAQATPTAVSKALELFMIELVKKGATEARSSGSKRVTAQHLKAALMKDSQFDFLTEICENVTDEGAKKGRSKSEAKSEDSDEDIAPKKKGKGGRKRRAGSDEDTD